MFFIAISFSLVWSAAILSLGLVYTHNLLYPACPAGFSAYPGFEPVELSTSDGIRLKGWWHPPANGTAVILPGGLGANRDSMLPVADLLVRNGFGALTLEYRHCAGKITTLGYRETAELDAMVLFAGSQPGVVHIAALGYSVGGAAALLNAVRNPQIEAVIAEGNYANLADEITAIPAAPLSLQWQIQRSILLGYWLWTGIWPADVSPLDSIPRIAPRPILFIHGEEEIERTHGRQQYAAAGNGQLWVVPAAGHGAYLQNDPAEYERRIVGFLYACFPAE